MGRINTDAYDIRELRQAVRQLAERNNNLERLLDGKEIDETSFLDGRAHQRKTKFSLTSGMIKGDWKETDITSSSGEKTDSIIAGTGISIDPVTGVGDVTITNTLPRRWSDWEFGFETPTTAVVTVNAGELQDSMLTVKAVTGANITVTDVPTYYIYVEYLYGSGNTPVIGGSDVRPVMDATNYRRILHTWILLSGVATLNKISHLGNITIPGTYATTV